jgi:hypothetical protein
MSEHFVEDSSGVQKRSEVTPSEYQTERFLNTINYDVLSGIMGELLTKSNLGYIPDMIDVTVKSDDTRKASGWHDSGSVTINAAKFDFNNDYKKDYRRILSTFIHEYVHANATGPDTGDDTGFKYVDAGGQAKNVPLNEGFTELIADYVYEEYMRRTGEIERFGQTSHKRTIKGYLKERSDAMVLVRKIAEDVGVPEDVVLGAYIRAYFTRDTPSFEDSL